MPFKRKKMLGIMLYVKRHDKKNNNTTENLEAVICPLKSVKAITLTFEIIRLFDRFLKY